MHHEHAKCHPERNLKAFVQEDVPNPKHGGRWHRVDEDSEHPRERGNAHVDVVLVKVLRQLLAPLAEPAPPASVPPPATRRFGW
jgi:hypothetical protein